MPEKKHSPISPDPQAIAFINSRAGNHEPGKYSKLEQLFLQFGILSQSYGSLLDLIASGKQLQEIKPLRDLQSKNLVFALGGDATQATVIDWINRTAETYGTDPATAVLPGGHGSIGAISSYLGTNLSLLSPKSRINNTREIIERTRKRNFPTELIRPWEIIHISPSEQEPDRFWWTVGVGLIHEFGLGAVENNRKYAFPQRLLRASVQSEPVIKKKYGESAQMTVDGITYSATDIAVIPNFGGRFAALDFQAGVTVLIGPDPGDRKYSEQKLNLMFWLAQYLLHITFPNQLKLPPDNPAIKTLPLTAGQKISLESASAVIFVDSIPKALNKPVSVDLQIAKNGTPVPVYNARLNKPGI